MHPPGAPEVDASRQPEGPDRALSNSVATPGQAAVLEEAVGACPRSCRPAPANPVPTQLGRRSAQSDSQRPQRRAAEFAHRQQRPCQRRRYWLFVKAATARPLLVQASTSSTPRGTARGSIAQRAIVGARVASCAASPSELRLHRHGRGGACLRAIALHRCNGALSRAPHDCRSPHGHRAQDLNGPAASITAPARSARHLSPGIQRRARPSSAPSRRAETRSRGAGRRRQCFHGNAPGDDRRSVPVLDPGAPPEPQDGHGPYRPARTTWRSPSRPRLRLDHVADAAPAYTRRSISPRRAINRRGECPSAPRRARSVRGGRCSPSPQPPDSGANQGALFRLTGNRPWTHCGPMEHPDRADPAAAGS